MSKTIIAGPCSAESYDQLRSVALELREIQQVSLIRAGVWKPRTRPGAFEGLGEPALGWMRDIAAELGVSFCCEVARSEHVALCQPYGIRTVWLGARTTTNPFMVEEICGALHGSDMRVLVKNPVCPDVRLWIGAIERLQQAGISDIAAVHRGFSMYHNNGYRNAPLWQVAMELRHELPQLPIYCDPSHIGGRRDLVATLASTALQLDYDGLMVEVHPHPDNALSDADQQITPAELRQIAAQMAELENHKATDAHPSTEAALGSLRGEIDTIDHSMLRMLGHRMELSRQIADIKRQRQMTVYQSARWADVMEDRLRLAAELDLDKTFIKDILERIHAESVRVQMG